MDFCRVCAKSHDKNQLQNGNLEEDFCLFLKIDVSKIVINGFRIL